ncbi:hypothetical protein GCM10019016_038900 [Streptomyces prasinosporus]|uniref:Uncharacterized protein n=1 Tax=Streptomyces prasinosporus TaxID=68256 RepID=A0ABP6TQI2_9ACTN
MRRPGRWSGTHGEHPDAARSGILLPGTAGTGDDGDVLKTPGAFRASSTGAGEILARSRAAPLAGPVRTGPAEGADAVRRGDPIRSPRLTTRSAPPRCARDQLQPLVEPQPSQM